MAWWLVALAARLLALAWAGPGLSCSYDECSYLGLARALASGAGWVTEKGFLWPPGYTAFLAPLVPPEGTAAPLARLLQTLLGSLLIFPVAALAARSGPLLTSGGEATQPSGDVMPGALAAHAGLAWVALDPTLVVFSHLLWPETLFLLLLLPAAVLLLRARSRGGWVLAGALFGLAGLVKVIGVWLGLGMGLAAASGASGGSRRRLAPVLWLLLGMALAVAPWTARNAAVYQRFVLIDATAGTNLYLGNSNDPPVNWDWGTWERRRVRAERGRCETGDFIQRDRCEQSRALAWMASHPLAFAGRALTKWADLVNPVSFLVRQVRDGRYGDREPGHVSRLAAALATAAAVLPWMAVALLAAIGLSATPAGPLRRLTLALLAALLLIHALTFGLSRFRLPALPFLAVQAGIGLELLRRGKAWPAPLRSRLALAAGVAMLVWLWALRLPALLDLSPFPPG